MIKSILKSIIKSIAGKIKNSLFLTAGVRDHFNTTFPAFKPSPDHIISAFIYLHRLNNAARNGIDLERVPLPTRSGTFPKDPVNRPENDPIYYYKKTDLRIPAEELFEKLNQYDIISFDIFDTAIYRKVEFPTDVFRLMAVELKFNLFTDYRIKAEKAARNKMENQEGHREICLDDIYDILEKNYGIEKKWKETEIALEEQLTFANPYIYKVYRKLIESGKTIIFASDMYLPLAVIRKILEQNGYDTYQKIYLSNEYKASKADGRLQRIILSENSGKRIIHVGDNKLADVEKSKEQGLDAFFNPGPNPEFREEGMDNPDGSFYRGLVNTQINSGLWNHDLYYEHGFRVGGILVSGFCRYINEIASRKGIDKILFCARDCEVIQKVYDRFYRQFDNEYIQISRFAMANIAGEKYIKYIYETYILKYFRQYKYSMSIAEIFSAFGYGYLNELLVNSHIDTFDLPASIDEKLLERFFYEHKDEVLKHNQKSVAAAAKYFTRIIGEAKKIMIVDIGWNGSCINGLKTFLSDMKIISSDNATGMMMCFNRSNIPLTGYYNGEMDFYISSPVGNRDLLSHIFGEGFSPEEIDIRKLALEDLFTSKEESLIKYDLDQNDYVVFERAANKVRNGSEITSLQQGIIDFCEKFSKNTNGFSFASSSVSPYTAFNPLIEGIQHREYIYAVYKNFTNDILLAPYHQLTKTAVYGDFFHTENNDPSQGKSNTLTDDHSKRKKILFVSREMEYTGAVRSLLRMCKVALSSGYQTAVWSMFEGPFSSEFNKFGVDVEIVSEKRLSERNIQKRIKQFDMAICNTVLTSDFYRIISMHIPAVWYIREAPLDSFCRNHPEWLERVRISRNICSVSDYAAAGLSEFTDQKIRVIYNCVENESSFASAYISGTGDKIKFGQFGTLEYRKGYDVLTAAYKLLPEQYKERAELYFAGRAVHSNLPFIEYVLGEINDEPNIHYPGVINDTEKRIRTMSEMDVIVCASRDESCSLTTLEGIMLSKPIIVTENVGAKYVCHEDNGLIVKTDDPESLRDAMIAMIDKKDKLAEMGQRSRYYYETQASMAFYEAEMKDLFAMAETGNSFRAKMDRLYAKLTGSDLAETFRREKRAAKTGAHAEKKADVIISLTTDRPGIGGVSACLQSLLQQKTKPERILLWLAKAQFPQGEAQLPKDLLVLRDRNSLLEIRWAETDLGLHLSYFHTMQEYPDLPVILVRDNVKYSADLVSSLMDDHRKYANCMICSRADLITFTREKVIKPNEAWVKAFYASNGTPSSNLIADISGGVLIPPKSLSAETFDQDFIRANCFFADDLWLKIMSARNHIRVLIPEFHTDPQPESGYTRSAEFLRSRTPGQLDEALGKIIAYADTLSDRSSVAEWIRKDRFR